MSEETKDHAEEERMDRGKRTRTGPAYHPTLYHPGRGFTRLVKDSESTKCFSVAMNEKAAGSREAWYGAGNGI